MDTKRELLIQSAARLYSIGIDLENIKQQIKKLVDNGTSYEAPEMIQAVREYSELKELWYILEQEHLKLKAEILSGQ